MKYVDRGQLKHLLDQDHDPCVSIFLPTHRVGAESMASDTIQLRNLLTEAESDLAVAGYRPPLVAEILAPVRLLLTDNEFWNARSEGLAIFAAPGFFVKADTPYPLEPQVNVARRFQTRPLLPLLSLNTRFHILALSQPHWRLFDCSRHTIDEVDLPAELPSLAENSGFEDNGGQADRGSGDTLRLQAVQRWLRLVNQDLRGLLSGSPTRLVLAGVESTVSDFRAISDYPRLVHGTIAGNPSDRRLRDLHAAAWELIEPELKADREAAVGRYQQLKGQGAERVSNDISAVVAGAAAGRVETLFISRRATVAGELNRETGDVIRTIDGSGDDLLDLAASETIRNGGHVYASDEALPDVGPVAAVFRY